MCHKKQMMIMSCMTRQSKAMRRLVFKRTRVCDLHNQTRFWKPYYTNNSITDHCFKDVGDVSYVCGTWRLALRWIYLKNVFCPILDNDLTMHIRTVLGVLGELKRGNEFFYVEDLVGLLHAIKAAFARNYNTGGGVKNWTLTSKEKIGEISCYS